MRNKKKMYRVNLVFDYDMTRSVFIKAHSRAEAEEKALARNPAAKRTSRSPFPQGREA